MLAHQSPKRRGIKIFKDSWSENLTRNTVCSQLYQKHLCHKNVDVNTLIPGILAHQSPDDNYFFEKISLTSFVPTRKQPSDSMIILLSEY